MGRFSVSGRTSVITPVVGVGIGVTLIALQVVGGYKTTEGLDTAPCGIGISVGITRHIGKERDRASRIELDERRYASDVRRLCVLDCRGREGLCAVVFDIDDIGCGEVLGKESKLLLNTGIHEEGSGLSMEGGEGFVTRVILSIRL